MPSEFEVTVRLRMHGGEEKVHEDVADLLDELCETYDDVEVIEFEQVR